MSEKSPPADTFSTDAVQQRAYYLWEADGRPDGRSEHYWQLALAALQAEQAPPPKPAKAKATSKPVAKPAKAAPAEKPKKAAKKADEKPAKKAATKPRASVSSKTK